MECIVDLQGFKRSLNEFVFKEVAILAAQDDAVPTVYYYQPPCSWGSLSAESKSSNIWLKYNLHGLSWDNGKVPYDKLHDTLEVALKDATKIYVKGFEKMRWLQEVLPKK